MARIGIPGRTGPDDTDWVAAEFERRKKWEREFAASLPTLVRGITSDLSTAQATLATTVSDLATAQATLADTVAALVLRPGVILPYSAATAPTGFLLCNGSQYSQTTYAALYAVVGSAFNTGGETSGYFRVPNLKGRVPVGQDSGQSEFNTLGETGGENTHLLTSGEMPSHTHTQNSHTHGYNDYTPGYRGWAATSGAISTLSDVADASRTTGSATATNQNTGGGGAHNNLQPYMALPYIIKT